MSKTQIPTGGIADDAISEEHIDATAITGTTALEAQPAATDEIIISDAGTLKRLDIKHIQNTPAFEATLSSNQTVTDENNVKVQFDTEVFDSDGKYDNSTNHRFTPTIAGKYFVYTMIGCNSGADNQLHTMNCRIYKNGSAYANSHFDFRTNYARFATGTTTAIIDMDADDYVESYVYIDDGSGNGNVQSGEYSRFGAFRITGI
jgi:hypothetical protein